ncbi:hypothetical protein T484DRAFT_1766963, partial [Baffinella frigidus]
MTAAVAAGEVATAAAAMAALDTAAVADTAVAAAAGAMAGAAGAMVWPRGRGGGGDGGKVSLLIRGISERTSVGELRKVFERYGSVKDVYIPMDFHTRQPKPFAFIE